VTVITKNCEVCGKAFKVKRYRKNTARFCSISCKAESQRGRHFSPDTEFKKSDPRLIGNTYGFTEGDIPWNKGLKGIHLSPETEFKKNDPRIVGENNVKYVEAINLTCEYCDKQFQRKPWELRRRKGKLGVFCSFICYKTWQREHSKEKSPYWVGGQTTYRGKRWWEIRREILNRDSFTCQICGSTYNLVVHHITPFREFNDESEANKLSNLITLCQSCHMRLENA